MSLLFMCSLSLSTRVISDRFLFSLESFQFSPFPFSLFHLSVSRLTSSLCSRDFFLFLSLSLSLSLYRTVLAFFLSLSLVLCAQKAAPSSVGKKTEHVLKIFPKPLSSEFSRVVDALETLFSFFCALVVLAAVIIIREMAFI
jgi:hypothetical protein